MATALADIAALAKDPAFTDRVLPAIVRVAVDIIIAANTATTVTGVDRRRRDLAEQVILDRDVYTGHFAWILASRDPVVAGITDAQLLSAVQQAWNHLSRLDL
jgi:hypothetical protein